MNIRKPLPHALSPVPKAPSSLPNGDGGMSSVIPKLVTPHPHPEVLPTLTFIPIVPSPTAPGSDPLLPSYGRDGSLPAKGGL